MLRSIVRSSSCRSVTARCFQCQRSLSSNSSDSKQQTEKTISPSEELFQELINDNERRASQKRLSAAKSFLKAKLEKVYSDNWKTVEKNYTYKRIKPSQPQPPVATLAHGLTRVLFNPGIHYLKDPRTQHYNFSPFLEDITQPDDFDLEALQPYISPSNDPNLVSMGKVLFKRYVGSTSSVSPALSQFYFILSNFKGVDMSYLSSAFANQPSHFTRATRAPVTISLKWKDGVYGIDSSKIFNDDEPTVLSSMGKTLEKCFTMEPHEYRRYLKDSAQPVDDSDKDKPESYAYGEFGRFLLRSQLDCQDDRLPRRTFDLKTRATLPVRLDLGHYKDYLDYTLKRSHGLFESFEREYYDMVRSAFLKYSFQVRIGHMDGILVAYHNTSKIFGFQYISLEEMDARLFGSTKHGDKLFNACLSVFQDVLDTATRKYPEQNLRISFDARETTQELYTYVEPLPGGESESEEDMSEFFKTDDDAFEPYDGLTLYTVKTRSRVNNKPVTGPLLFKKPSDNWTAEYFLTERKDMDEKTLHARYRNMRKRQALALQKRDGAAIPFLRRYRKKHKDDISNETVQS